MPLLFFPRVFSVIQGDGDYGGSAPRKRRKRKKGKKFSELLLGNMRPDPPPTISMREEFTGPSDIDDEEFMFLHLNI